MPGPSEGRGLLPGYYVDIKFTQEPHPIIQQGAVFTVSVLVAFGEPSAPSKSFALNVSLIGSSSSNPTGGLSGRLTSDLQFGYRQNKHAFAVFKDLAVCQTGTYQLRVLLGAFSRGEMVVEGRIDSDMFQVVLTVFPVED
ncbi:hypothetical protein N7522_002676 [Penicillium canescens]|nr:hypothetical protein N7522_002676 [Penicillium canescens]